MNKLITSKENETIKYIKKLSEKKYRDEEQKYIIEGIKIVEEAIQEKAEIEKIIISEQNLATNEMLKKIITKIEKYQEKCSCQCECIYATETIFKGLTQVINPQGIIAVVKKNSNTVIKYDEDIIVVLDDIQDPGNLGTILRTVDSIGLKQLVVSKGTADVYNPKVVRSTMGAIFRVNVIEKENIKETIEEVRQNKYRLIVSSLQTENNIYDIDYNRKIIVMGNEANGVRKEIQDMADEKVKIPMLGKTESLNVSVATGIILYEYVRQKINM
ncbi:MAG: RNA methyltransferase [Clostridia bacterium]|jgi:TrmH family RNA methyltransferase|nr:RNA methyltransferase [Clostridia bacterium]